MEQLSQSCEAVSGAIYDNFLRRHSYTTADVDGRVNDAGLSIRQEVRQGIKRNRESPKEHPLGGPHYADLRRKHPRQIDGFPESPEGMVPHEIVAKLGDTGSSGIGRRRQELLSFLFFYFLLFCFEKILSRS